MKVFNSMNKNILLASIVALGILPGCQFFQKTEDIAQAPQLRVINVLDNDMYVDAHIKGSINIPFDEVEAAAQKWNKKDTIVVYCSNYACSASGHVASQLKKDGFESVYAYEGGMADWYQRAQQDPSFKVEGNALQPYLTKVMEAPEHTASDVTLINADDLRNKLVSASELNY